MSIQDGVRVAFCVVTFAIFGAMHPAPVSAIETCGDVNDDGIVASGDALALLHAALGELRCYLYVCDLNGDDAYTATDALAALSTSVGLPAPSACPDEAAPSDQYDDRIAITNTPAVLADRVLLTDEEVVIEASGSAALDAGALVDSVRLRLVASVTPPTIDGQRLQATSVHRSQNANHFIVTYNMQGEPRLGGVEYFDLTNASAPVVTSQALFSDTDVSAGTTWNFVTYLAAASDAPAFTWPATLEQLSYKKGRFFLEDSLRIGLTSYAATSVAASGNVVYATSGDGGALFAFDRATLVERSRVALDDLRWVDVSSGYVVAVQGTPGRLCVIDPQTLEVIATWPFPGADIPESKSTVVVRGGKAFIAAGSAGVQVLSLATGALLGSLPVPVVNGLDPSLTVANAVAVDGTLVFVSNGEAGVYAARLANDPRNTGEQSVTFTSLGKLQFGALESVNHVEYQAGHLIIASGLGGLKVVRVN